jgi:hypothetical protein
MSDAEKAYQATPASTLEEQIMNPCIAKNEREWWAAAEIERLRAALDVVRASGLLIGSTTLHDKVRAVVHAALAEENKDDR